MSWYSAGQIRIHGYIQVGVALDLSSAATKTSAAWWVQLEPWVGLIEATLTTICNVFLLNLNVATNKLVESKQCCNAFQNQACVWVCHSFQEKTFKQIISRLSPISCLYAFHPNSESPTKMTKSKSAWVVVVLGGGNPDTPILDIVQNSGGGWCTQILQFWKSWWNLWGTGDCFNFPGWPWLSLGFLVWTCSTHWISWRRTKLLNGSTLCKFTPTAMARDISWIQAFEFPFLFPAIFRFVSVISGVWNVVFNFHRFQFGAVRVSRLDNNWCPSWCFSEYHQMFRHHAHNFCVHNQTKSDGCVWSKTLDKNVEGTPMMNCCFVVPGNWRFMPVRQWAHRDDVHCFAEFIDLGG